MKTVGLIFYLDEEVTPELLAVRVAQACAKFNALRPGEQISTTNDSVRYRIEDQANNPFATIRPV